MVSVGEEPSKRTPLTMQVKRNRAAFPAGEICRQRGVSCGNNSDATSSREDSDSDCTCDVESSSTQEDSGRFSADFGDRIIAPPSPFVTRSLPTETSGGYTPLPPFSKKPPPPETPPKEGVQGRTPLHSTTIYIDGSSIQNEAKKDPLAKVKRQNQKKEIQLQKEAPNNSNTESTCADQDISHPTAHTGVNPLICKSCVKKEVPFFNPICSFCWAFFSREDATPSQVFAVLRLWIPEVQKCIGKLVRTALSLGCGVRDRDAVTDMTLLHYAVKAGSYGIGDPLSALQVVADLIRQGADLRQRCKWTTMTALHYAAFFDVPNVLEFILKSSEGVSLDDRCQEYNNGTALHIAASNLSEGAVRVLLRHGASPSCKDSLGRMPQDCIPSPDQFELVPDLQEMATRVQQLFRREWNSGAGSNESGATPVYGVSGRAVLKAVGLKVGDRVLVSGLKTAILRYAGPTEFATGLWAGVELETPQGRHNGTVKGVLYFRCAKNYGLFVPINRLTKIPNVSYEQSGRERVRTRGLTAHLPEESGGDAPAQRRSLSLPPRRVNHGRVNVSKIASKVAQDIRNSERKIVTGDRVCVDAGLELFGVVRFTGAVHFASGYWIGVELEEARGSHDGSVCGTRYFTCRRQHGIFAASSRVLKTSSPDPHWTSTPPSHRLRSSSITSKPHAISTSLSDSFSSSSSSSSSSTPFLLGEEEAMPLALPGIRQSRVMARTAFYPTNTSMSNLNRCFSGRYISSRQRQDELERRREEKAREPQWQKALAVPDVILNMRRPKDNPHWLQIGHNVFYKNKIGTVRYIGRVHFAEGRWLGLELREKRGRHDGRVNGRRYFACKKGFGVMVPPNKVTVHGLNGAKLVKTEEEEPRRELSYDDLSIL